MYKPHLPFCPGSRSSCCDYVAWSLSVCALGAATRLQSLALLLFSHRNLAHSVTSPSLMLFIYEMEGGGQGRHNTCYIGFLDECMSSYTESTLRRGSGT